MTIQKALLKIASNGGKPVKVTLPRNRETLRARQMQKLLGATIEVYKDQLTADIIVRASYTRNRQEYGFEEPVDDRSIALFSKAAAIQMAILRGLKRLILGEGMRALAERAKRKTKRTGGG